MDKIRWGVLGTGYIAGKFAEALSFIPDAGLIAVGSRTQKSAETFARQYKVPRIHASYQALADDPNVDVVYIATVNTCHRENCLTALEAGKPVLCEKPFMVNTREAEEVIALAREKKVFLMEALWTRFIPAFQKAVVFQKDNRMGDGARVFLGSAELAAMVANLGRIPTVEEYFAIYREKIEPGKAEIYRCLQFDDMEGY